MKTETQWGYSSGMPGYLPDYTSMDYVDAESTLTWSEARACLIDWIMTYQQDDEDSLHNQGLSEDTIEANSAVYGELLEDLKALPEDTPWTGYGPGGRVYFSLDRI